ncbi:CD047 protein, partial [Centropus bengalensis]|nr:CD047 protein [Centropus bengalensis]
MPMEGKSDMERIGLFSEMSYVTIGDRYVSHFMRPFNEAASKNKQMLPGGSKVMSDLQAGYFEPQFVRIFEGEAYSNPVQLRRRRRLAESKKNLGNAFIPSNGDKLPCGLGSYYGTIGGPYPYFSAQVKDKGRYISPGKNFYTNPGKKGSGYGYANLTIGPEYPHEADGYDLERINAKKARELHKRLLKGGAFKLNLYPQEYFDANPYFTDRPLPPAKKSPPKKPAPRAFRPSSPAKKVSLYSVGAYVIKKSMAVTSHKEQRIFHPPPGPKSRPIKSIIALNVTR